jgi:hypothetical protein
MDILRLVGAALKNVHVLAELVMDFILDLSSKDQQERKIIQQDLWMNGDRYFGDFGIPESSGHSNMTLFLEPYPPPAYEHKRLETCVWISAVNYKQLFALMLQIKDLLLQIIDARKEPRPGFIHLCESLKSCGDSTKSAVFGNALRYLSALRRSESGTDLESRIQEIRRQLTGEPAQSLCNHD